MSRKIADMDKNVAEPALGNKYWWLGGPNYGPAIFEVIGMIKETPSLTSGIRFHAWVHYKDLDPTDVGEVEWTIQEWLTARSERTVINWLPPITEEDLAADEEICRSCNGARWEQERDSEILACIWCSFTGKKKKPLPPPEPTHERRSSLHPEMLREL